MTLRQSSVLFIGSLFVVIAAMLTPMASVGAQEGGSGLQLTPTRSEVRANPGEQKEFTVTLKNITQSELGVKAILNDFESDGVTGTPKILVNEQQRTAYSISSMLRGLQDVNLKAGETKEIKLSVDVPGDVAPGAYFGAVRFSVVPKGSQQGDRQIALNASVAHLVFVEIPGDVIEQIKVESLALKKDNKTASIFFGAPTKADLTLRNLGNGFARPFGTVEVKNMFGSQVTSYEVNNQDQRSIVLPKSTRTFTNDVSGIKLPGRYTATASVAYGNGGEVVTYKAAFWYLPVWFLVVAFIFLLVIIGLVYALYKRLSSGRAQRLKSPKRTK